MSNCLLASLIIVICVRCILSNTMLRFISISINIIFFTAGQDTTCHQDSAFLSILFTFNFQPYVICGKLKKNYIIYFFILHSLQMQIKLIYIASERALWNLFLQLDVTCTHTVNSFSHFKQIILQILAVSYCNFVQSII